MNINDYGFLRVAAASPKLKVADCDYNIEQIKQTIKLGNEENVQIICFPELCITGYTCADLFLQKALQDKAYESLLDLNSFMIDFPSMIAIVGLPLKINGYLYNVAAVLSSEGILGFVPKTYLPNHNEFYEKRWFTSGADLKDSYIEIGDEIILLSAEYKTIFRTPFGNFGIELCEDLWHPIPPSSYLTQYEVDAIFNLSASNELIGKNKYRRQLILQQSARCNTAYVYANAGIGESSTDLVFSGACFIAENGTMLAESKRFSFENELIISDIDIAALRHDRLTNNNHKAQDSIEVRKIETPLSPISTDTLMRSINPHPFIPSKENADENFAEDFNIQTHGLAKRLLHTGIKKVTIGISGGLDSTLALLVTLNTFDILKIPRENIVAITMPGFGTTDRTYNNAIDLIKSTGATLKEISIVKSVTQHFEDIEHDINNHDVTYENAQARERTQILMDYANKIGGLVVGTGNLSELALGWATYNGDHMSMYAVNSNIPKTLVKSLTRWIANTQTEGETQRILNDILDTPFSPELLPANKEGKIAQITEDKIGPYELHDFFLHRMLRHGDEPKRILFLAEQAFAEQYSHEEILKWLKTFYRRFFSQQFKRSCMPDGPKIGSVSLSPRGDWRMPSDAVANVWLKNID